MEMCHTHKKTSGASAVARFNSITDSLIVKFPRPHSPNHFDISPAHSYVARLNKTAGRRTNQPHPTRNQEHTMGRGDKRTRKGKIFSRSFGNTRRRKAPSKGKRAKAARNA
jgi:ribosomal small subunit protein bTHX